MPSCPIALLSEEQSPFIRHHLAPGLISIAAISLFITRFTGMPETSRAERLIFFLFNEFPGKKPCQALSLIIIIKSIRYNAY